MQLKKLKIELETWGDDKGKYKTEISFTDMKGEIELKLNPEASARLIIATSDAIKGFAYQAQAELVSVVESACRDAATKV